MIYIRNIFKQDLRNGKQIAFPKEVSNVFLNFDYNKPDPDREISFKFKEENSKSNNYNKNGTIINTRLYAAASEARIDGELKQFLLKSLNAKIDDIIIFKSLSKSPSDFAFEFIPKSSSSYNSYETILKSNNHKVIIKQENLEQNETSKNEYIEQIDFDLSTFHADCKLAGLIYSDQLITRYISSLTTKPFVLLSGLSGSGKTKLAQSFSQWICESEEQYCIVPVGADWINREPLLGYVNALEPNEYILPENKALELIIKANKDQSKPYFLILDEMNLSHVERYFADFLSVMESNDKFKLHSSKENLNKKEEEDEQENNLIEVPNEIAWPENLFVVGTVNIDETTYMFSPKVLDRANVIEFRIDAEDLNSFFESTIPLNLKKLYEEDSRTGLGAKFSEDFVKKAKEEVEKENLGTLNTELEKFFRELQKVGAEFGYRSASEIQILFKKIDAIAPEYTSKENEKIDIAIMQKLLPKLHGSRSKLVSVLKILASLCYEQKGVSNFNEKDKNEIFDKSKKFENKVIYPISLEKITRMYHNVTANGFTSYAEA